MAGLAPQTAMPPSYDMASRSLRRELSDKELSDLSIRLRNTNEDLSQVDRKQLEAEVLKLRAELNHRDLQLVHTLNQYRDVMSHGSSTKDDSEYLHINQTKEVTADKSFGQILQEAGHRALGGGLPGAMAMAAQVTSLMWMRTMINFQYNNGTTTAQAFRSLWKEGGLPRFYRGYLPAMAQGPLSRFGDTAANAGVMSLMDSNETTKKLPTLLKTMAASAAAASWRVVLMPIDTVKSTMQVHGQKGFFQLKTKLAKGGPSVLFHGAMGASAATFAGHYPWFATFNLLNANLPQTDEFRLKLARNAFMGFTSSAVSDTISNSLRVLKIVKQASADPITYKQAFDRVVEKDGLKGVFGRGLKTRILANGMQGMMFSVIWKGLEDYIRKAKAKEELKELAD